MILSSGEFFILAVTSFCGFVVSQHDSNDIVSKNRISELSVLTPGELIKGYNYPVEKHEITTEDGYILSLHRFYGKNGKNSITRSPILAVSGIMTPSSFWLFDEHSLVFRLADLGYDIWLLDSRGTTYSRGHKNLHPDSSAYWNYSLHEMGTYDIPNTIDYILENTKQKSMFCLTHSQAGALLNILLSKLPEYNKKIRLLIHMAPAVYITHIIKPANMLARSNFVIRTEKFIEKNGYFGMLQNQGLMQSLLANEICGRPSFSKLCNAVLQYSSGPNFENTNVTKIPMYASNFPAGASVKQILHFGQIVRSGEFVEYVNYKEFFAPSYKPKTYNLSAVTAPTAVFYGSNDWVTAQQDVERFISKLPNLIMKHLVEDKYFNHADFVLGINRYEMLDQYVIALLNKF